MTAWMVRAGSAGEREQWAQGNGYTGTGYGDVESLTDCATREDVMQEVSKGTPNSSPGAVKNFVAQLWALKERLQIGDLVVMPLNRTSEIAIGSIDSEYTYLDNPDRQRRHVRRGDVQSHRPCPITH